MAFLTRAETLSASRRAWGTRGIAETQVKKAMASSMTTFFDIFLSHSFEDAEVIAGVKLMLEAEAHTVYVDWLEDPQADRSKVSPATANMLRERMNHCRVLLYATSEASPKSKWMPWELGYFDGRRPGRVGILPIVQSAGDSFKGQEYLGLYPNYESIRFKDIGYRIGTHTGPGIGDTLKEVVSR